jgi:hypothetical protein
MANRDIFSELIGGVAAIKSHREGKLTLRSYKFEIAGQKTLANKIAQPSSVRTTARIRRKKS